ncbi:MAG TPA: CapA family protein, partial [Myxococcus sp.]|nr:CapA family protein [Myxococcus sp.]
MRKGWLPAGALTLCLFACTSEPPPPPSPEPTPPVEDPGPGTPSEPDPAPQTPPAVEPETPPPPPPPPGLASCAPTPAGDASTLPASERKAREAYACTAIALEGTVLSPAGSPVANATVRLGDTSARTDTDGRFRFPALPRHNVLLQVEAEGFRPSVLAVELRRALSETQVSLSPLRLSPKEADGIRMLFGGDVSLGRRFLDPSGQTPRNRVPKDHPDALIKASDPLPGTMETFKHIRPFFQAAEFRSVNLESPVTDRPHTPHSTKDFAFFTLPGSLPALTWLGIDYVSLGNNHVYDYLETGLQDTLRHVTAAGLAHSGAGRTPEEAFRPWRATLGGAPYSFVSMCGVSGTEHEHSYVATATQGGAADLRDFPRVAATLNKERDEGRHPIAILHTGVEFGERPADFAAGQLRYVVDQGAALVIAHHPHTAQGFLRYKGVLVAQSLGNLAFDQDRLETMVGLLTEVELKGPAVSRARALPMYIEDYRPRPVTGELAESVLRNLSELSREGGVELVPHLAAGELLAEGRTPASAERTVEVPVTVDASGAATVDLRPLRRE